MLTVHSIETFGTHDGPGIRMVVFTQGCNFRCLYCHNPDTQCMTSASSQQFSTAQIIEKLEKQRGYFGATGGLTVSGGEPTLQMEGLTELFETSKQNNFHTCLDTNGFRFDQSTQRLYDLTDLLLLDVKHIDPVWHQKITGHTNGNVLQCAAYRESTGKPIWLRYVLVPGFTDQPEYIESWAKHFSSYSTVEKVEILPYHLLGVHKYQELGLKNPLEGVNPPTPETITQTKSIMERYLKNIV